MKYLYHCIYFTGGGEEINGGIWELKETNKTIKFKQVLKSFFNPNYQLIIINKDITKNKKHCFRDWGDGTYTIYPEQCGKPHLFTPISEKELQRYKLSTWNENN